MLACVSPDSPRLRSFLPIVMIASTRNARPGNPSTDVSEINRWLFGASCGTPERRRQGGEASGLHNRRVRLVQIPERQPIIRVAHRIAIRIGGRTVFRDRSASRDTGCSAIRGTGEGFTVIGRFDIRCAGCSAVRMPGGTDGVHSGRIRRNREPLRAPCGDVDAVDRHRHILNGHRIGAARAAPAAAPCTRSPPQRCEPPAPCRGNLPRPCASPASGIA